MTPGETGEERISARVAAITKAKLLRLAGSEAYNTQTIALTVAIDRLYRQVFGTDDLPEDSPQGEGARSERRRSAQEAITGGDEMFLTGTYTLSHARWDHLTNDEPEALGVTQEQAAELCEAVDAGWERAVQHAGREFGLELKVEWVDAGASHCLKMDSDGFPLTNVVEVSIREALEQATDHVTGEWSKQHFSTK